MKLSCLLFPILLFLNCFLNHFTRVAATKEANNELNLDLSLGSIYSSSQKHNTDSQQYKDKKRKRHDPLELTLKTQQSTSGNGRILTHAEKWEKNLQESRIRMRKLRKTRKEMVKF